MTMGVKFDGRTAAWSLGLLAFSLAAAGCARSDPDAPDQPASANGAASTNGSQTQSLPPIPQEQEPAGPAQPLASDPVEPESNAPPEWNAETDLTVTLSPTAPTGPATPVTPELLATDTPMPSLADPAVESLATAAEQPAALRPLRDDLSLQELVQLLAAADKDMELIHINRSGIEDPNELRETLLRIVNRKLQAAEQLARHGDATAEQISEGNRGQLQALSHLAALSDVNAAERLEQLARDNMSSQDERLVAESRLVLIGFAIESLQHGNDEAAQQIVSFVDQIAASHSSTDVPALIVMGQAKEVLENYGHGDLARHVRDAIINTFADSTNPEIARMAAQAAGNVQFDGVDQLREQILGGADVTTSQWTEAVETLIDESADLQTVRYLAGAAVDFEASGKTELAGATLSTLRERFADPQAATTAEVELAIEATEARQNIIGQPFDPQLSSLDGQPLSLDQFRGQVVLMPFWAMGIPLSLQPIATLRSIRDAHPGQVTIVGLNLDAADAPLNQFVAENQLDFPSFRVGSDPTNTIPRDFGVVSFPFVAILDAGGRVASIQLTGQRLRAAVQQLIAEP